MKRTLNLFIVFIILFGCKKEHDRAQWHVAVLAPLFKATLKVDNLIADSLRNTAPDGAVTLVYNHDIYSTPVDSIFRIRDTTIFLFSAFPPLHLPASFSFPIPVTPIQLTLSGAQLKRAVIKKGYLRMTAKNQVPVSVIYTFSIPKAKLNGVQADSLFLTRTVGPGTSLAPAIFDTLIDMTGYDVDMTGNGSEFNKINYNVTAITKDTVTTIDTIYNIHISFLDLVPTYARGYLGQNSTVATGSKFVSASKLIKNGTILLDSVTMKLTLKNNVGADAQALITSMKSINTRVPSTVNLTGASVINRTINLNRATENGPYPSTVNPSYYTFSIDNTNSNLLQFIQNIPDSVTYDVKFSLNPLGNISGHNDFIYTDSIFNANLDLRFPLRFAANQLTFVDTQGVSIANKEDFDAAGPGTFTIIADNGFPWEMDLQIQILDENNHSIDNILVPGIIAPAPVSSVFRAIGKQRTKLQIPVDEKRKNEILSAPRIAIKASLTTSAYPQVLQIYADYSLDLKLIADAKYLIR